MFRARPAGSGISIHALLAESDGFAQPSNPINHEFQSTLSLRRATAAYCHPLRTRQFQSTLSLRRATATLSDTAGLMIISIHALLAESDSHLRIHLHQKTHFNPRSPCGERPPQRSTAALTRQFQSTLSLRRATETCGDLFANPANFNPRSPCGERPSNSGKIAPSLSNFNPRSPCGERRFSLKWMTLFS